MALFPIDPVYSKTLILSDEFGCSKEVIAIISMLSVENLIIYDGINKDESTNALATYSSNYGDHITLLRIFNQFKKESNNGKEWCKRNKINYREMLKVVEMSKQIKEYWLSCNYTKKSCDTNEEDFDYSPIRKCFCSAFFMNIAVISPNGDYQTVLDKKKTHIHPSSVLFQKKAEAIVYNELLLTTKEYMRNCLRVNKEWILELQPHLHRARNSK